MGNVFLLSNTSKNAPAGLYFAQNSCWFLWVSGTVYTFDVFLFVSGFLAAAWNSKRNKLEQKSFVDSISIVGSDSGLLM